MSKKRSWSPTGKNGAVRHTQLMFAFAADSYAEVSCISFDDQQTVSARLVR
tara:strand:+ start:7899 stop:8051 length:153 start_codon:yes stop_codon:yes gene_type:complete